jgi:hypothetical protein
MSFGCLTALGMAVFFLGTTIGFGILIKMISNGLFLLILAYYALYMLYVWWRD